MSADVNEDLMSPDAWTVSSPLPFAKSWVTTTVPPVPAAGFLEGTRLRPC